MFHLLDWRRPVHASILVAACVVGAADPADALTARDTAVAAGLGYNGITQGDTPVFRANDDSHPDIFLNTHNAEPWRMMFNRGDGTFTRVMASTFRKYDRHGCVAADFGSSTGSKLPDGRQDLFCVVGACQGSCTRSFPNELWIRQPDGSFVDVARAWGVGDEHGRGRAASVVDVNRDGLPDLAIANLASASFFSPNRLFLNRGGRFEEVVDTPVRRLTGSECMASFLRQDGYPDLVFCAKPAANKGSGLVSYRNNRGRYQEITASTPYRGLAAQDVRFADVNGDARPDLLVVTFSELSVWLNVNDSFPQKSFGYPLRQGRGVAACNIDNDARRSTDLYVVDGKARGEQVQNKDVVLLNDGTGKRFTPFTAMPQATQGDGDKAVCIPNWRGSSYPAILVTNGKWITPGPNQFLVFADR